MATAWTAAELQDELQSRLAQAGQHDQLQDAMLLNWLNLAQTRLALVLPPEELGALASQTEHSVGASPETLGTIDISSYYFAAVLNVRIDVAVGSVTTWPKRITPWDIGAQAIAQWVKSDEDPMWYVIGQTLYIIRSSALVQTNDKIQIWAVTTPARMADGAANPTIPYQFMPLLLDQAKVYAIERLLGPEVALAHQRHVDEDIDRIVDRYRGWREQQELDRGRREASLG